MDQPWYRHFFRRSQKPNLLSTRTRAEAGEAEAQFSLGLKYAGGEGTAQDYVEAAQWYLKAANQGHRLAQFNLGVMCSSGQGLPKDLIAASTWFEKAALQGDAGAQYNLGLNHYNASVWGPSAGAVESRAEAYKWFYLAGAQGYKNSASLCESLNLKMTSDEVADANRRADAFVAANPPVT